MKNDDLRGYMVFEDKTGLKKSKDSFHKVNNLMSYRMFRLEACPFCGKEPSVYAEFFGDTEADIEDSMRKRCEKTAFIECENCGATGPLYMKLPEAEGRKRGFTKMTNYYSAYDGPVQAALHYWNGNMYGIGRSLTGQRMNQYHPYRN